MPDPFATNGLKPESLATRIRWLLLSRVLVVTIFLGATAVTHVAPDSDPDFPLREVAALIVVAYLLSLLSVGVLPRIERLRGFAFAQICTDVFLISVAVLLTGGLQSPMAVWYNLAIIGGAILLLQRGAWATAALSSITYGVLMNLVYYDALPFAVAHSGSGGDVGLGFVYQIAANIGSFFSIAFLSSILVERLARTQEALEVSEASRTRIEAFQKALIQNLESGVLTTDMRGSIESANPAVETVLGRGLGALIGQDIVELFPVLRSPVGPRRIVAPSGNPTELSYRPAPDLPMRTLRCTSAPLTDTYQQPIGMLFILQDISKVTALMQEMSRNGGEEEPAVSLPEPTPPAIGGLVGESPAMKEVLKLIQKVAPAVSTALITGESGTGKELAARAIHSLSPRRNKPMVVVNCAAIPENLIESELFGHVKGAYTGAVSDRRGLFRAADGGTIFLDEIGDLPLVLQVKLLRVLQERSFTPVGGQTQVAVDVRIIAATNRDLEADVAAGRFREDLFYRLNVIRIHMPPLRERREDLPVLIRHFVDRFGEGLKRPGRGFSQTAMRALLSYSYPGNIRELENVIEHSIALAGGTVIGEQDLPDQLRGDRPAETTSQDEAVSPESSLDSMRAKGSNLDAELEEVERRFLEEALQRAGGVRKRAAEILGINYRSLRHRLGKYGFGDQETKDIP